MEVADATDHGGPRHHLVTVGGQFGEKAHILRIALDQPVVRVMIVAAGHRPVLTEVVDPNHLVAGLQQFGYQVAADEAGGAGHEDLHRRIELSSDAQISTTSRPSTGRSLYILWGAPTMSTSDSSSTVSSGCSSGSGT